MPALISILEIMLEVSDNHVMRKVKGVYQGTGL